MDITLIYCCLLVGATIIIAIFVWIFYQDELWWTAKEVARRFSVSQQTIERLIELGYIMAKHDGKTYYIVGSELKKLQRIIAELLIRLANYDKPERGIKNERE